MSEHLLHAADKRRWEVEPDPPETPLPEERPTALHLNYILARLPIIGLHHCPEPDPIFRQSDLLKLVSP